jgi:hypothetical protein
MKDDEPVRPMTTSLFRPPASLARAEGLARFMSFGLQFPFPGYWEIFRTLVVGAVPTFC